MALLTPDLLFASQVQGRLAAAGHEVRIAGDEAALKGALGDPQLEARALLVDLTDASFPALELLAACRERGELGSLKTLAYYSHIEADTRTRALAAGFDQVVPRSRMAREAGELLDALLDA